MPDPKLRGLGAAWVLPVLLVILWGASVRVEDAGLRRELGRPLLGGRDFRVLEARGVGTELRVLGGKVLDLRADEARFVERRFGPFAISGLFAGLRFDVVRAELAGPSLSIRAERALLDREELRIEGRVRIDGPKGKGLLFAPSCVLSLVSDRIQVPQLSVLAPSGSSGGMGGRVLSSFDGSARALLELRRR